MNLSRHFDEVRSQVSLPYHGLNLLLILGITALLTLLKQNYDNTLENHAMWDPVRLQQRDSALGVTEFYRSRQTLFGNKLNLHQFGGFHEVNWRGGLLSFPLAVNASLETGAELSVIYHTSEDLNYGFKLQRDNQNFFFIRNSRGRYEKIFPFSLEKNLIDEIKVFFSDDSLIINKNKIELPKVFRDKSFNKLSLRGGYYPTSVHQVSFGLEDIIRYRFSFMNEFWGWVTSIGIILCGLYIALFFIFKFHWKNIFFLLFIFNTILGSFELLDRFWLKGSIPEVVGKASIKGHNFRIQRGKNVYFINNANYFNITKWDEDLKQARRSKLKIFFIHSPAYFIDLKEKMARAEFKEWTSRNGHPVMDARPFLLKLKAEGEVWNHQQQLSEFGEKALNLF